MSVVALATVRSCGVTTLGLALAATWPSDRRVLLVEADPAGGTLAAAADWPPEPGLVSLAAATRRDNDLSVVFDHCHTLPDGVAVLAAPSSSEQARHALSMLAGIVGNLKELDADVVLDCGRLESSTSDANRLAVADRVLLVARPRLADLHTLGSWLAHRSAAPLIASGRLCLVLVGDGPYPDDEVEEALGLAVLGRVPFDPEAADALVSLAASDRLLRRAPLVRAARTLADHLAGSGRDVGNVSSRSTWRPLSVFRQWHTTPPDATGNAAVTEGMAQ